MVNIALSIASKTRNAEPQMVLQKLEQVKAMYSGEIELVIHGMEHQEGNEFWEGFSTMFPNAQSMNNGEEGYRNRMVDEAILKLCQVFIVGSEEGSKIADEHQLFTEAGYTEQELNIGTARVPVVHLAPPSMVA